MRMWMVDLALLCRKHLLGEHVECHMLLGAIKRGKSLKGFLYRGLLEPAVLRERHDALAAEMVRRGYKHNSPMLHPDAWLFEKYPDDDFMEIMDARVDVEKSIIDLCERCPDCRARIEKAREK